MNWIAEHNLQIALTIGAAIILTVGRSKILPRVRSSKFLLWVAFIVTAACGLILGYSLYGAVGWITSAPSRMGGGFSGDVTTFATNLIAVASVAAGWWALDMGTALVRDIADGTPDEDARRAALWMPTMAPAGFAAAWAVASNPAGVGTDLTALAVGVVSVLFCVKISKTALAARKGAKAWKWYAALVCLLAGVILTPLMAYADGRLADVAPGWAMLIVRIALGAVGLGLLIAALVDIVDKVPDKYARAFVLAGVPLLAVAGTVAVTAMVSGGASGADILIGGVQ